VDQALSLIRRPVPETAALRFPGSFRGSVASLALRDLFFSDPAFQTFH
jgi:hypothetical protein